jgi:hypothetical protein
MPKNISPKIQPWKALSSLAEDKNPDLGARNLRSNEPACTMGASVTKPMDRKVAYEASDTSEPEGATSEHAVSEEAV